MFMVHDIIFRSIHQSPATCLLIQFKSGYFSTGIFRILQFPHDMYTFVYLFISSFVFVNKEFFFHLGMIPNMFVVITEWA